MNVYKRRLLKKSSNRKSKLVPSTLVTTWLSNLTFHLRPIWLQTLVAIDSELRQTSFPSFCVPPSEVAALFNSNLSRRPFLGQVVDLDLLLCTGFDLEHAVLFLCQQNQRLLRDEWMPVTERLSEAMAAALVCSNFSQIPWKFHFTWKTKLEVPAKPPYVHPLYDAAIKCLPGYFCWTSLVRISYISASRRLSAAGMKTSLILWANSRFLQYLSNR